MTMDTVKKVSPDFIVAGAMKSGTTWLHRTLDRLENVKFPEQEIHILDCNDPFVHPDFVAADSKGLVFLDASNLSWTSAVEKIGSAYSAKHLVGWDSTTLFHSKINFRNLAEAFPKLKILVVLRNPTERAFSHYWHLVRTGRATSSFEGEISRGNLELLDRSIYRDQAKKIKEAFGERVCFMLYENIFKSPEAEFDRLADFLCIGSNKVKSILNDSLGSRENSGMYPNWLFGWLLTSRVFKGLERGRYSKDILVGGVMPAGFRYLLYKLKIVLMVVGGLGFSRTRKRCMKLSTREYLNRYFREANYDLDEIIGLPSSQIWYL
ncbi:sulfotransferase [Spongiibacter taiwanensis]